MRTISILRYPGSKAKLWPEIFARFPPDCGGLELWSGGLTCYCEPFVGSGAIAWRALTKIPRTAEILLCDMDIGIVSLWQSVRDDHAGLCVRIRRYRPCAEDFYRFKEEDGRGDLDPLESGFRKLALHRISYSGLGFMAGSPLGGKAGGGEYNPECRWNPDQLIADVLALHRRMSRFRRVVILHGDFAEALSRVPPRGFAYLDPPYYVQGAALYRHAFGDDDHRRLAGVLRDARFRWVLSYDDHEFIRGLYSWAEIVSFEMTPTTATARNGKRRKNSEILISGGRRE